LISFLNSVVPTDAFVLNEEFVTFVSVSREGVKPTLAAAERSPIPAGAVARKTGGALVFSPDSVAEAVASARRRTDRRLRRASVVFPDSWVRTMTLDFDVLPAAAKERAEMVAWKVRKLMGARPDEHDIVFSEISSPAPKAEGEAAGVRLLVSAAPRETMRTIQVAFARHGVQVGRLVPASLALLHGFDARLAAAAGGDYLLLYRGAGVTCLWIARDGSPLFFRQKLRSADDIDDGHEIRLTISYYSENLGGGEIKSLFLCDEEAPERTDPAAGLAFLPLSGSLLGLDESISRAARNVPEIWPAAAAALGAA
jgi:Tfp pilus assembly PilM family ATPase